jgi:hypothetical protein
VSVWAPWPPSALPPRLTHTLDLGASLSWCWNAAAFSSNPSRPPPLRSTGMHRWGEVAGGVRLGLLMHLSAVGWLGTSHHLGLGVELKRDPEGRSNVLVSCITLATHTITRSQFTLFALRQSALGGECTTFK